MPKRKEVIPLKITNNTNVIIPIDILANRGANINNVNDTDLATWDMSAENYSGTSLTFQVDSITYNLNTNPKNINDVVDALNRWAESTFPTSFWASGTNIHGAFTTYFKVLTGIITIA